jgi:hypothetical protein
MKKIGQGQSANVFKNNKTGYARKHSYTNNLSFEFTITKLIHDVVPDGVVNPRKLNGPRVLIMNFVKDANKKINLQTIKKVLKTLITIQKKFPSFRHNDLYKENVFNEKMGDFGLASMSGLRNPVVVSGVFEESHGIGNKTSSKYDAHLFLNSIYVASDTPKKIKKIIERIYPSDYLGHDTDKIKNYRLRYSMDHSKLPSSKKILDIIINNEQQTD